ncbi:MAG: hypothetical protein H6858_04660 [Rhodospirillales bacterium]|nr:hypothetical protein [Rhodospirillales bacterium]
MTQQKKRVLVLILSVLVTFGWACVLFEIIEDHLSAVLGLSILIPAAVSAYVIWLMRDIVPQDRIEFIRKLSHEIGEGAKGDPILVPEDNVPEEISPLVHRLNQMIAFQRDRYEQERDFTAHASHELRTPLAGIRLQTELAMSTSDQDKRDKAFRNIIKAVDRATRLVEQLLALSRLTAEDFDYASETVDLVALGRSVIAEHMEMARTEKIELIYKPKFRRILIEGNEESLRIMIDNLLRNALTYTPDGGRIVLSVEKDHASASLSVTDTGPGIPAHLRETVLKRFQKADQGSKSGTGLGLAIVKRIVSLHQGSVDLGEGLQGRGLRVTVVLPLGEHNA